MNYKVRKTNKKNIKRRNKKKFLDDGKFMDICLRKREEGFT